MKPYLNRTLVLLLILLPGTLMPPRHADGDTTSADRMQADIPQAVASLSVTPRIDDVETRYWSGGEFGEVEWRAILLWLGRREGCNELYLQWLDVDQAVVLKTVKVPEVVCGQLYVHSMEFVEALVGGEKRPVLQLQSNRRAVMQVFPGRVGEYRVVR